MKVSKLKGAGLAVAAAATMFAGSAHADTLLTDGLSLGISTGLVDFKVNVDGFDEGVAAGSFKISNLTNGTSFLAFCADIRTGISVDATDFITSAGLEYDKLAPSALITDATQLQDVQALYDQRYAGVDLNDKVEAAAFQITFWELLDDKTLAGGSVKWAAATDADEIAALALAQDWLSNLSDPTVGSNTYDLTVWDRGARDPNSQPYIQATAAPSTSVPEPGTLMLGLAGLAGLGLMRRKS